MNQKNIFAVIAGAIVESYNNIIYGFFSAIIAPIFFPTDNNFNFILAGFGTFAAGFALKPLGGFIFGYIGDTWGRKLALRLTIILSSIAAFSIGFAPSFQDIGWAASLILISSRLLQGLASTSDYTGSI
nr:MFS transporter [Nitrosopumilus sp.]